MTPVHVKLINPRNNRKKSRQLPCYPNLRTNYSRYPHIQLYRGTRPSLSLKKYKACL